MGFTYGGFDDTLVLDASAVAGKFDTVTKAAAELAASGCSGLAEGAMLFILKVADLW